MRLTRPEDDGGRTIQFSQKEIAELAKKKVPKGFKPTGSGGSVLYKGVEQWQVDIVPIKRKYNQENIAKKILEKGRWYSRSELYDKGFDAKDIKDNLHSGDWWTEIKDGIEKFRLL